MLTVWLAPTVINAQQPQPQSALHRVYEGKYHFIEPSTGDTLLMLVLNPIYCFPEERFKSKKDEEFYWRTVRDVRKTLPYAKLICSTMLETYEYIETFPTQKEREDFLKEFEGEIYKQYKPVMKGFTKGQGKMLIKLIDRETSQSSYNIVKAFMGTFRANMWYVFGKFFGVSMRTEFKPDKDETDAMIERICLRIEQGSL